MRILFMANLEPNPNGGASGTEVQTISALRDLGHEIDTVWAKDLSHQISHYSAYNLLELPIAYRRAMLKKFRRQDYDVVHVNQPHGYLAARYLRARRLKTVLVHRSHGFEGRVADDLAPWRARYDTDERPLFRQKISRLMENMLRLSNHLIARFADGHIVSAAQCRDHLTNHHGVPENRIAVIPQAPPTIYQTTPAHNMTPARLRKLLYVGQYAFIKGPMVLARGIDRVLSSHPETTFTWVCDERHHRAARQLFSADVLDRISFIGWRSQEDLMEIYDTHGVFLFPSFFEGFGKAFLEAMTRGLIVVASDNGGMRDTIKTERNGILFPTGESNAMVDACASILDDFEKAETISENARKKSLHFTWARTARETVEFYKTIQAPTRR